MDTQLLNNDDKKRLKFIDLVKSVALLFVTIYHNECYNIYYTATNDSLLLNTCRAILSSCVPLFFLVNGFLLFNKEFDLKKHTKKIIKLVVLTVISGIITLILILKVKGEVISAKDFFVILYQMREGYVNHLWFMGALICIYIFFPLLKNSFDNNKKIFIWFIIICAIITFGNKFLNMIWTITGYLIGKVNYVANFNFFHMFNPLRGLFGYSFVYFCIGGLMFNYIKKIKHKKIYKLYSVIIILISSFLLALYGMFCSKIQNGSWDFVWHGMDTIFTFLNTIALFVLCVYYNGGNKSIYKVLYYISSNSLLIYIVHMFVMHLTMKYVKLIPLFSYPFGNIVYALSIMFVSLILAVGIKRIAKLIRRVFVSLN